MAAAVALVSMAVLGAPAGAAPQGFTLSMVTGGGQVQIGSNPNPLQLTAPTTLSGTGNDETGAVTGLGMSTPPIEFQQESSGLLVDITASFSEVSANSGTGSMDGLGNVSLSVGLVLDLHIVVGGGAIITDCVSSPIQLDLSSVAPYDTATQSVTLRDAQFTIPPVANDGVCNSLVSGPINEQLAGPNNSISLQMTGALPLPPPPGDPSETTLTSNIDSTPLGQPVTFTATVSPDDATGTVQFFNGAALVGQAPVEAGGVATLVTTALPVGENQIVAKYSGDVNYGQSQSAAVLHTVTAVPGISSNLPPFIVVGAPPVEMSATVTNPEAGADLPNLRVDLGFGALTGLANGALIVEMLEDDGETWTPLTMTGTSTQTTSIGGLTGFALAAGESRDITLRLSALATARQGALPVLVSMNSVDADTGAVVTTLATSSGTTSLVPESRRPTTAVASHSSLTAGVTGPIRAGFGIGLTARVTRGGTAPLPTITGTVEFLIDDVVVGTEAIGTSGSADFPIMAGAESVTGALTPGIHYVSVRYSGDGLYRPSVSPPEPLTVYPWVGTRYLCEFDAIIAKIGMATQIYLSSSLPAAAPAGTTLTAPRFEVALVMEAGLDFSAFPEPAGPGTLTFSNGASGTFMGLTGVAPAPGSLEAELQMLEPTLSVPIEGDPGDAIDLELESFTIAIPFLAGANATLSCAKDGEAATLPPVAVSGTTVSTTATSPVRVGDAVPLTANVFPSSASGVVQFMNGTSSLGFAPLVGGVASMDVTSLPAGTHSITAKHLGDVQNLASESEPIEVVVQAIDCAAFAEPGSMATVRLTYLVILGRCPDAAGAEYWADRLDGGMSASAFARSLAYSAEAHRFSVIGAYDLVLQRAPSNADRDYWGAHLGQSGRYDGLIGSLAASPEFWNAGGGDAEGFVGLLYERIIGRTADQAGLDYWVGRLEGGESRAKVAAAIMRLPEPSGSLVGQVYDIVLDRAPTAAERTAEVAQFRTDGSRAGVASRLIGTTEFAERAAGFPNS